MKVKVLRTFRDKAENLKLRSNGDVMEVTEARGKELKNLGFVEDYTEPEESEETNAAE